MIVYQDFKSRSILWFLPLIIFLISLSHGVRSNENILNDILLSVAFLVLQLTAVLLYLAIKNKTLKINLTEDYLGLGDVLFFLAITPLYPFQTFLLVIVIGLIFSLIGHLIVSKITHDSTVPLAGWMSIFILFFNTINLISNGDI